MNEVKLLPRNIDVQRVQRLLQTEFNDFCDGYHADEFTVTAEEERRGFLILWLAVFLPEVFPDSLRTEMQEKLFAFHSQPEYKTHGWYRLLNLDVTLFALSGDYLYLTNVLTNIDHHSSSLRELVCYELALVADRIPCYHPAFFGRIERYLEYVYFFPEWPLAIFAVSSGSGQDKIDQINKWLAKYGNPNNNSTWSGLAKKEVVDNPFLPDFMRFYQYLAFRFLETSLPVTKPEQTHLPWPESPTLSELLWKRINVHPLMKPYIELKETD